LSAFLIITFSSVNELSPGYFPAGIIFAAGSQHPCALPKGIAGSVSNIQNQRQRE